MGVHKIICGKSEIELKQFDDDSFDSCVCDPPYGLEFMGKDWDKFKYWDKRDKDNSGLSQNEWSHDAGDKSGHKGFAGMLNNPNYISTKNDLLAFQQFTYQWATELYRVMKPGAHILVFGSDRTEHRMKCGIEDAGFEIRGTIPWIYGSGFSKSLDISKAIDKKPKILELNAKIGKVIKQYRTKKGLNLRELGELCNNKFYHIGGTVFYETGKRLPSKNEWDKLREVLEIPEDYNHLWEEVEREIIGKDGREADNSIFGMGIQDEWDITTPKTEEAIQWDGWGTGLKPAVELICMARKPISERNIAANVLRWGVGGINIKDTRISLYSHELYNMIGEYKNALQRCGEAKKIEQETRGKTSKG